jgi:hypothetical protein
MPGQGFESRSDIEQFLVDAALAQAVEGTVEVGQQFVDILVGALPRCQAAGILAGEGLGAGA